MRVNDVRAIPADAAATLVQRVDGGVSCGFPSPSQDYITSEIDLNEHLMPHRASTYIVRADGHSMQGVGIYDGDELIVDRGLRASDGSVAVVSLDGELTVKRIRRRGAGVILTAENPDYPPIEIPELADLRVWGIVTRCLHYVR